MRRAPIVITATVLGTAGVLLFKPLPATSLESTSGAATSGSQSANGSDADPSTSTSTGSTSTDDGASASDATGTGASGTTSVKDGTYTGDGSTTRFGTTQVSVTITGGKITDVQAVALNSNDPRSSQISQSAAPLLRSEVLSKQTAAVDTISGATYTSAQYEASLQSALDKAGYAAPDGSTASTDVSGVEGSGGFGR